MVDFEEIFSAVNRIVIDSREDCSSALFVPIKGEKQDGHRFIPMAIEHGAKYIFTAENEEELIKSYPDVHFYPVKDTLEALQEFGAFCRKKYKGTLIGITGSVGKTTTREMIATALSSEKKVFQTKGNANSQIGVPITLFAMARENREISVIEMGVSLPGEMERLAKMASVDFAVFTNIGDAHLENMHTKENTCFEKLHILMGEKRKVELYLPKRDPILSALTEEKIEDMGFLQDISVSLFFYDKVDIPLPVPGEHMKENAGVALLLAKRLGISENAAVRALTAFRGLPGRGERLFTKDGITIIDDSYNASPSSMKAAVQVLSREKGKRRIAVLGDMNELGTEELILHREVGEEMRRLSLDCLFTLGEKAKEIRTGLQDKKLPGAACTSLDELEKALSEEIKEGDVILFKASHSLSLSTVIKKILEEHGHESELKHIRS